jgi:hypothetical protein
MQSGRAFRAGSLLREKIYLSLVIFHFSFVVGSASPELNSQVVASRMLGPWLTLKW